MRGEDQPSIIVLFVFANDLIKSPLVHILFYAAKGLNFVREIANIMLARDITAEKYQSGETPNDFVGSSCPGAASLLG